jgi:hypothetical protein
LGMVIKHKVLPVLPVIVHHDNKYWFW